MKIKKTAYSLTWGIIFILLAIIIGKYFTPNPSLSSFLEGLLIGLGICLIVVSFIWRRQKAG